MLADNIQADNTLFSLLSDKNCLHSNYWIAERPGNNKQTHNSEQL